MLGHFGEKVILNVLLIIKKNKKKYLSFRMLFKNKFLFDEKIFNKSIQKNSNVTYFFYSFLPRPGMRVKIWTKSFDMKGKWFFP